MTGAGTVQSASAIGFETLYAGYRWDGTAPQMYYVRNRFLLSMVGTWNKRDPLGYVEGLASYSYVSASPLRAIDPTGLVFYLHGDDEPGTELSGHQHHWFPQAERLRNKFDLKCGAALSLLYQASSVFIHFYVTTVEGGWGKGQPHYQLHNPELETKYSKRVEDIYDNSTDCCDLLTKMRTLIRESWTDEFWRTGNVGPQTLPRLEPYYRKLKVPQQYTNQRFEKTIDLVCRMQDQECNRNVDQNPIPFFLTPGNQGSGHNERLIDKPRIDPGTAEVAAKAACTGVAIGIGYKILEHCVDRCSRCASVFFGMFDPGGRYSTSPSGPGPV